MAAAPDMVHLRRLRDDVDVVALAFLGGPHPHPDIGYSQDEDLMRCVDFGGWGDNYHRSCPCPRARQPSHSRLLTKRLADEPG